MNDDPALELPPPAPRKDEPEISYSKRPKRQRQHVDHFRTDDDEHAELAARARDAGLSVDAFCRLMCLGDPGPRSRRTKPTVDTKLLARNMAELNRIGGNLNQGIRALNEIALSAPAATERDRLAYELETLRKLFGTAIDEIARTLAANREALGYDRQG